MDVHEILEASARHMTFITAVFGRTHVRTCEGKAPKGSWKGLGQASVAPKSSGMHGLDIDNMGILALDEKWSQLHRKEGLENQVKSALVDLSELEFNSWKCI